MSTEQGRTSPIHPVIILLFVFTLVFIASGTYLYLQRGKKTGTLSRIATPTKKPTPTPTPLPRPLQHGKGSFSISASSKTGPTMTSLELNPYDPAMGAPMILRVAASNTVPITSIAGTMKTDKKTSAPFVFSLVEGTDMKGTWEAKWIPDDTYLYEYTLTLTEKSTNGEFVDTLGLR